MTVRNLDCSFAAYLGRKPKTWLVACSLLGLVAANAEQAAIPFPGARHFLMASLDDHDLVIQNLYKGKLYFGKKGSDTCKNGCGLSFDAGLSWDDRTGHHHQGWIIVAEETDGAHADAAAIGMVDFLQTPRGWIVAAGSPVVAKEGAFGVAPEIHLMLVGGHGMAVVTMPGFTNQGQTVANWELYLDHGHAFKLVIRLPMTSDSSGLCEPNDRVCRKDDFTSSITVDENSQAGLTVLLARISFSGHKESRNYPIRAVQNLSRVPGRRPPEAERP